MLVCRGLGKMEVGGMEMSNWWNGRCPMGMEMSNGSKTSMEIRWAVGRKRNSGRKVPIFISTSPSHIHPIELRDLYSSCNHSAHRFPDFIDNLVEAVDLDKLRIALSHSSVLVSVFGTPFPSPPPLLGLGDLFQSLSLRSLVSPSSDSSRLVGFGRAVSDSGLTASIYDVMVIPSLQGMGIGKMIVDKIIRILNSRDIYDIAALCSPKESLFFKSCGFGDDMLGSTTMMYARTEGDSQIVISAGRKILVAPPLRKPFQSS